MGGAICPCVVVGVESLEAGSDRGEVVRYEAMGVANGDDGGAVGFVEGVEGGNDGGCADNGMAAADVVGGEVSTAAGGGVVGGAEAAVSCMQAGAGEGEGDAIWWARTGVRVEDGG